MGDKNTVKMIWSVLIVVLGNILYALAVKLFLIPAGLVTGGTTGIGLAVNYAAGVPVATFVLIFNVVMLAAGFAVLGKQFALTTIVSTFTYPLALNALDMLLGDVVLTQDVFICTMFSGLGIGLSLGIVIRAGASTGGMDIPPLVLNHFFKIPVSVGLYFFDFVILLVQALFQPLEKVFYGIVLVIIYTVTLDKMLLMGTTKTEVRVVSDHAQEICDAILKRMDRGVTLLSAKGGYLKEDTTVVLSVISNRELPRVERLIHEIDPESFIVVNRVSEVSGKGFTMNKEYR
ncbi:MAG: YitT family protein [Dorea sp.]|nr:YitT family protein [Dorea sp.]